MKNIARAATAASLALLLVTACSQENGESSASAEKAAKSQPQLGSGIATENFDESVRPQDDFYRYVNGKWLDRTEIPADRSNYGSFTELAEEAEEAQLEIIKAAAANADASGEERKIGDFYTAFMDKDRVEELGMAPATPMMERIDEIESHEDVIRYIGEQQKHRITTPIGFWVNNDSKEPTRYAVYLTQNGLGLPNRDYYEKEGFADKKAAYGKYIADLLDLSGFDRAPDRAAAVLDLEERMAMVQWTPTENRDRNATYNKFTLEELNEVGDNFDWPLFLEAAGIHDKIEDVIVRQPSYAAALGDIVRETDVETWKDYFRFHGMNSAAPFLSSDFVELHFDFNGRTLAGTEQNRPRWKRAVGMINNVLGEAVGKI
ncbi:MAG: M13 family metallopeptidase N-terminal domain-containing protein, partial [Gammaproteobacteria bacterium]|nr:M13 family metallopeptidase N-terminal domain-containing protein [Gammaproteobacteria bacterium]